MSPRKVIIRPAMMKYSVYAVAASTCLADHSGEEGERYPDEIRG
jgi:hypothetical protein